MKVLLFSFLLLTISTCKKGDSAIYDKDIDLYQQEPVYFGTTDKLSAEVIQISDSRCPEGVACIWQGYASATIRVKSDDTPIAELSLCLGACTGTGATAEQVVEINSESYKIQLKQIAKRKGERLKAIVSFKKL